MFSSFVYSLHTVPKTIDLCLCVESSSKSGIQLSGTCHLDVYKYESYIKRLPFGFYSLLLNDWVQAENVNTKFRSWVTELSVLCDVPCHSEGLNSIDISLTMRNGGRSPLQM